MFVAYLQLAPRDASPALVRQPLLLLNLKNGAVALGHPKKKKQTKKKKKKKR